MDDPHIRRLFSNYLAHKTVLCALIASHPDHALLLKSIHLYSEPTKVGLLNLPYSDEYLALYEAELNTLLQLAEKYAQE